MASQPASENNDEQMIRIGKVGRPHGVRGAIRVFADAPESDTLGRAKVLLLRPKAAPERRVEVIRARPSQKYWIVELVGSTSREHAEALVGATVHVSRSTLPAVDADTFYETDLIGLHVVDPQGEQLGRVTGIFNNGAHEVLMYKDADGSERMVPFLDEFVEDIDLDARTVCISPLEFDEDEPRTPRTPKAP